ncbi:hypothetical protein D9611_011099 [Ephemerocybe angulata]|uniref:Uncharacterized protein n=1 Tax=Ephemerocybe angulata TaxID=980116 RepID=A0A8H5BBU6_9AGAR|nr:hypothetical protein D9611_011099 [Tulosesus angulatus]
MVRRRWERSAGSSIATVFARAGIDKVDRRRVQTKIIWYRFRVDAQRPAVGRAYTARPGDHFAKGFSSPAERSTGGPMRI